MKIDYNNFYTLWGAALESTNREQYISEWSTSDIFYPAPEQPNPDMLEGANALGNIWDTAHMKLSDYPRQPGLTTVEFANLLCVPRRTLENWESRGPCHSYYRLMIAKQMHILKVDVECPKIS